MMPPTINLQQFKVDWCGINLTNITDYDYLSENQTFMYIA